MRILLVIPYFYPAEAFGGPVKVAFDEGKELVKRGHDVVVFASDAQNLDSRLDPKVDDVEGMRVYYFRNVSMFLVKWSKLFITPELPRKMKLDLRSFDIIHAHEYTTFQNIVVHGFAKKYGVPYVLQVHGSLPKFDRVFRKYVFDLFFGYSLLRDASKVIALSHTEAAQYKQAGVPCGRIKVIPNGIDPSAYLHLPPKGFFAKKFNMNENSKIILYLGRIHKTKGMDLLVKAYANLVKGKKNCDSKLVIAGPDDGYLKEIQSLAESLEISDSVLFTGFLSDEDKLAALTDATVFVTPSFYGFPVTFLEACAAGTPIVTTTLGDPLEWIHNNVGYVTSPTPRDLAEAIKKIISDDGLRQKFSEKGQNVVLSNFSLSRIVDKLEKVYQEVVESPLNCIK